jgi:hypothetical protein
MVNGPVQAYLAATACAAAIVLFGALYALLLALWYLRQRRPLLMLAGGAYLLLASSTLLVARALDLHGAWLAIPIALLVGYLLAPHAIWRLCVGIEGAHPPESRPPRGDSP